MDVWRILVYAVAALLAVRSLFSLMTIHRQNYLQQVLGEEKQRARERRKLAAAQAAQAQTAQTQVSPAGAASAPRAPVAQGR